VASGREALYYMRYDDSPERVQLPFIYYAVFGNPQIKVVLPEEVEPIGSVFDTVAVLDSTLLIKSTSQRALIMDGAKKNASLVVNTSLKPEVILKLVKKNGCAQDWKGKIITLRAKKYDRNIAFGMIGAITKAMEPLYKLEDVVDSMASSTDTTAIEAVRSAYDAAEVLNVSLKAKDCAKYRAKTKTPTKRAKSSDVSWWDREAYNTLKAKIAAAPTYEERIASMPTWRELAPGLIEFGPPVGERNIGFKTSFARTFRPVLDKRKCVNCKQCHVYCPDGAIDYDPIAVNYDYCKGCGICARVCGSMAIRMEHELKADEGVDEEEFLTIREALIEYAY
jgi:pyruvate ferredoxin oxidoreductase delta subunit